MIQTAKEQNEYEYNKESKLKLRNELERVCLLKQDILLKRKFDDKEIEEKLHDQIKNGLN